MENQNQDNDLKAMLRILLGQASSDDLIPETIIDDYINALLELKRESGLSLSVTTGLHDSWPRPKKRQRVELSLFVDNQNPFESVNDWSGFPISQNVIQYFHKLLDEFSVTVPIELKSVTQIQGLTRDYSEIRSLFLSNNLIEKLLKPLNNGTGTTDVQEQLVTIFLNLLMEDRITSCFSGNERFFSGLNSLLGSRDSMVILKASLVLSFFVNDESNRKIIIGGGGFKHLLQFLEEADSLTVCLKVPTQVAFYLLRDVVRANSDEDLIVTAVKVFLGYIKSRKFVLEMLAPLEFMSRSASVSEIFVSEGAVSLIISLINEQRGEHIAEFGVAILEGCCRACSGALTIVSKELDIQIVRDIQCNVHKFARRRAEALMMLLNDRAEG